jgi:CheY-like chemotaxis protein
MSSSLANRRVLVVEDEYFVAQQIARAFRELGAQVLGPVPTSEAAIAIAREKKVDAAVLDIHLRGCWEIKRFGIVTEKGSASSNINARVAAFLAAMKRSN